jgi:hypothetical protein
MHTLTSQPRLRPSGGSGLPPLPPASPPPPAERREGREGAHGAAPAAPGAADTNGGLALEASVGSPAQPYVSVFGSLPPKLAGSSLQLSRILQTHAPYMNKLESLASSATRCVRAPWMHGKRYTMHALESSPPQHAHALTLPPPHPPTFKQRVPLLS